MTISNCDYCRKNERWIQENSPLWATVTPLRGKSLHSCVCIHGILINPGFTAGEIHSCKYKKIVKDFHVFKLVVTKMTELINLQHRKLVSSGLLRCELRN